jgi:hypothetical protein
MIEMNVSITHSKCLAYMAVSIIRLNQMVEMDVSIAYEKWMIKNGYFHDIHVFEMVTFFFAFFAWISMQNCSVVYI